jgi:hypothetical protein
MARDRVDGDRDSVVVYNSALSRMAVSRCGRHWRAFAHCWRKPVYRNRDAVAIPQERAKKFINTAFLRPANRVLYGLYFRLTQPDKAGILLITSVFPQKGRNVERA